MPGFNEANPEPWHQFVEDKFGNVDESMSSLKQEGVAVVHDECMGNPGCAFVCFLVLTVVSGVMNCCNFKSSLILVTTHRGPQAAERESTRCQVIPDEEMGNTKCVCVYAFRSLTRVYELIEHHFIIEDFDL